MDKRFWGALVIIVVVLGGIWWFTSGSKNNSGSGSSNQPTSHIEGEGKDGITLIEYGDYQCPYCGQYASIVSQVASDYNQEIFFQFRNLPLTELHPNAFAGARAAEAAALQGKFWQMHDFLYQENVLYYEQNESTWITATNPEPDFEQYARQLGLNVNQFEQDYQSAQVNNAINADTAAFAKTGQEEATPTFFLDGTKISPSESFNSFAQYINAEILKKTGHPSTVSASGSATTSTTPQSTQ